jgi:hypothetical protein
MGAAGIIRKMLLMQDALVTLLCYTLKANVFLKWSKGALRVCRRVEQYINLWDPLSSLVDAGVKNPRAVNYSRFYIRFFNCSHVIS